MSTHQTPPGFNICHHCGQPMSSKSSRPVSSFGELHTCDNSLRDRPAKESLEPDYDTPPAGVIDMSGGETDKSEIVLMFVLSAVCTTLITIGGVALLLKTTI